MDTITAPLMRDLSKTVAFSARRFSPEGDKKCSNKGRELMSVIAPVIWAGSFCVMGVCVLYWHWRIYSLYRSLDDVRRKFVYTEFSFQFQSPSFAAWLGGPMFRDGLSLEQQMQVATVSRQLRPARVIFAVCGAVCFLGLIGSMAWDLVRHRP